MATETKYTTLRTLGEFKAALRTAKALWVWVCWEGEDGDYIEMPKAKFLRSIGADAPCTGADGGRPDATFIKAEMRGDECYVG